MSTLSGKPVTSIESADRVALLRAVPGHHDACCWAPAVGAGPPPAMGGGSSVADPACCWWGAALIHFDAVWSLRRRAFRGHHASRCHHRDELLPLTAQSRWDLQVEDAYQECPRGNAQYPWDTTTLSDNAVGGRVCPMLPRAGARRSDVPHIRIGQQVDAVSGRITLWGDADPDESRPHIYDTRSLCSPPRSRAVFALRACVISVEGEISMGGGTGRGGCAER